MSDIKPPLNPAQEKLTNQLSSNLKYFSSISQFREFFSNGRDSLVGKSIISTVDQVALSATNFAVGVILLKTVSLGDYGRYSFFFSLLMLIVATHGALIVSPMNVLVAGKRKKGECDAYITSLLAGQFLVYLPFVILGMGAVFFSQFFENLNLSWLSFGALLLACLGAIFREFFKPVFYNRPKAEYVLWIDLLYIGAYLSLFLTTVFLGEIHWQLVYVYMFAAATLSGILGVYYLRRSNFLSKPRNMKAALGENFQHGRWILPSVVISNLSNYSFMYLLIFLLGDEEAGLASGTRLTVMPLLLFMLSWVKVAVPHGSKLREAQQFSTLNDMLVKSTAIFLGGIALYGLGIYFFRSEISDFLFEEKLGGEIALMLLWLVYSGVAVFRRNTTVGLQILKEFKLLFYLNLSFTSIGLIFGFVLIKSLGIAGSILAMILTESCLAISSGYFYIRKIRRSDGQTNTPSGDAFPATMQ